MTNKYYYNKDKNAEKVKIELCTDICQSPQSPTRNTRIGSTLCGICSMLQGKNNDEQGDYIICSDIANAVKKW